LAVDDVLYFVNELPHLPGDDPAGVLLRRIGLMMMISLTLAPHELIYPTRPKIRIRTQPSGLWFIIEVRERYVYAGYDN
jgi:hypothetical protein